MRRRILGAVAILQLISATPAATQTRLFVDPVGPTARIAARLSGAAGADARMLAAEASAAWFTDGTPAEVRARVDDVVGRAAAVGRMPVLVAYNIPFRDCALYSAGGARDGDAYGAWISAFAAGIGDRPAIVVLEPDGLGVIPGMRTLDGRAERCQPDGAGATAKERFALMRTAVSAFAGLPKVRIYLDGTTSSWLSPGDAAYRLVRAGVADTAGFFLNVSNYESDTRLRAYARAVSDCIALVTQAKVDPRTCPSADSASSGQAYDAMFRRAGSRRNPARQKHAILDTSRNGRGSWVPPAGRYVDAEVWCNPPGRGLGRRPTLHSDDPYVDAFLWIKIPGESDGECRRGTAGPADPERGVTLPPAGHWYPDGAHELIENAVPPL